MSAAIETPTAFPAPTDIIKFSAQLASVLGEDVGDVKGAVAEKGMTRVLAEIKEVLGLGSISPSSSVTLDSASSTPRPVNLCQMEPTDISKFVLTRGVHPKLDSLRDKMAQAIWFPSEIKCTEDLADWTKLTDGEKHFVSHVLAFFVISDGIVNENMAMNLSNAVKLPEAKALYGTQFHVENIHSDVYRILVETFHTDPAVRLKLFNAVTEMEAVRVKADLAIEYMHADISFEEKLLFFLFVEGIMFSSSFCAIYWLKKRGLMPNLCLANYLISRDEGLHTEYAATLLTDFIASENKPSPARAYEMLRRVIDSEDIFVTMSLPVELIGMNSTEMKQHVRYVADGVLAMAEYEPLYNVPNPFDWLDTIMAELQTNFYEGKVGEYNLDVIADEEDEETLGSDDDDY